MNNVRSAVLGLGVLFFVAVLAGAAPFAHAQDVGDGGDCCGDYGSSYVAPDDYGSSYITPDDYGSSYVAPDDYGSSYVTPDDYGSSYVTPDYYSSSPSYYSTPSSYGYATPSYYSNPTNFYPSSPASNTYAPTDTLVTDNGNTDNSYNSTTDTCIYSGSCSVDDHSVVNANTTISSPTTVTVTNPPASQTQIVYNNTTPYYQTPTYSQPTYYPPAPVCTTCSCNSAYCPQPVVYNNPTPYVTLSQVPYTGLDLGPIGTVAYWSILILFCLFGAYLIVVKRAHYAMARSMRAFLFGSADVEEAAQEVAAAPARAAVGISPTKLARMDATDDFILSQIRRA